MVYSCCFSLGGNLDFLDFLQKKFYNINYRSYISGHGVRQLQQVPLDFRRLETAFEWSANRSEAEANWRARKKYKKSLGNLSGVPYGCTSYRNQIGSSS